MFLLDVAFAFYGSAGLHRSLMPISVLSFEVLLTAGPVGFWVPATVLPAVECSDGGRSTIKIGATAFFAAGAEPVAVRHAHGDFPHRCANMNE